MFEPQSVPTTDKLGYVPVKLPGVSGSVAVLAHQLTASAHKGTWRMLSATNAPSDAWGSQKQIDIRLSRSSAFRVSNAWLKIVVAVASDTVELVPAPYFFERYELIAQAGSGDIVQRYYSDYLFAMIASSSDNDEREQMCKSSNMNPVNCMESMVPLQVGTHCFYLPLVGFLEQLKPHLNTLAEDMILRLTTRSGITASGSGTVTLTSLDLVLQEDQPTPEDFAHSLRFHAANQLRTKYLAGQMVTDATKTWTAGSQVNIDLQELNGDAAGVFIFYRGAASPAATSQGLLRCLSFGGQHGSDTTIDIQSETSTSELCNGAPLASFQWRNIANQAWSCDFFTKSNVLFIPFGNIQKALNGVKDGYFRFNSTRRRMVFNLASAAVAEVQTITKVATANDQGVFHIEVVDKATGAIVGRSDNSLAFDATTAAIKTAADAIPILKSNGWSTTWSATMAAGAGATNVTIAPAGYFPYLIRLSHSLNDGNVGDAITYAIGTPGTDGFVTDASASVFLYFLMWNELVEANGRFRVFGHK